MGLVVHHTVFPFDDSTDARASPDIAPKSIGFSPMRQQTWNFPFLVSR